MDKPNLLINLPQGFFTNPALAPIFDRLNRFATVRRTSHNTPEEIATDLAWAQIVLMWSWPALVPPLLDQATQLKFAAHLDINQRAATAALQHHLPVSVYRGGFSPAVAEMALANILCVLRHLSDHHAAMRTAREVWVKAFPDDIDPTERELTGRSVGIIGFGQIGRRLCELLQPFHCQLFASDPFVPGPAMAAASVTKVELPDLLRRCDIVVVAASSNPGTTRMIGPAEIAALKKDAVFVLISRAALVDTEALVTRLKQGHLFAAIDVFDHEPLSADHPLRTLPNAYLSPHRAGGIMASVERIISTLVDEIEAFTENRPRRFALTETLLPMLDA